ncbi:MAG TPA: LuxR C-terminal-related transcriptional regulator [Anaeromyxobacteraceae bacterium]|nr:LuxR C-terminal-related transcriptional regulator [Anaeromyxobacteraceae bacterium]
MVDQTGCPREPRAEGPSGAPIAEAALMEELAAHLRAQSVALRAEWARRIGEAHLLSAMSREEIFAEATLVYDQYVEALQTGTFEALQSYSRELSERLIPRGVETGEVVGSVLLLRDVLARSLYARFGQEPAGLDRILDAYEPAANRIATTVAVGFVEERERVIQRQRDAIRTLAETVSAAAAPLTSRESQVLRLVGEGKSTKEAAAALGISVKTAESHRCRLMRKLDVHETASLVRHAIRRGLVQP